MPSPSRSLALLAAVAGVAFFGGCATPGVNHAYLASRSDTPIIDRLPGAADTEVLTYLPFSELYGIAYDPFTDHLFLRASPGDFIRVIDRPAGKIKRSFHVQDLPPGRGDLAIRSSDRHLFFVHPNLPALLESDLFGKHVRTITLEGLQGPPDGVAYDQKHDRLLILKGGDLTRVVTYDLSGKRLSAVALDRNVRLTSLAYDSVAGELYAPLADEPVIGIFSLQGHFLRSLEPAAGGPHNFVDVGQRALLRLF